MKKFIQVSCARVSIPLLCVMLAITKPLVADTNETPNLAKHTAPTSKVQGRAAESIDLQNIPNLKVWSGNSALSLAKSRISLGRLRQRGGVALLKLRNPDEIAILIAISPNYAYLSVNGQATIIPQRDLSRRFAGEAFIYGKENEKSSLQIDEPLQVLIPTSTKDIQSRFKIYNRGKSPITLAIESTSCGCTGATLESSILNPGSSQFVTIVSTPPAWGTTRTVNVAIRSSDPLAPRVNLGQQVTMPTDSMPVPDRLTFQSRQGFGTQRSINLLLPKSAEITSISNNFPFISMELGEVVPRGNGNEHRVRILLSKLAPLGEFHDEILFKLKNAERTQIGVGVAVSVKSDIKVIPSQIFVGEVSAEERIVKTFLVKSESNRDFSIQSITSNSSLISVTTDPLVTASSHAVEVRINSSVTPGSLIEGRIHLSLSNGETFDVPIVGRVSDKNTLGTHTPQRIQTGMLAPDFSMIATNDQRIRLHDLMGKNVVLSFFPKCFTGGCASQMESLQKNLKNFEDYNTQILAVSVDSQAEQKDFVTKLGLQFPLLSDVDRKLCFQYAAVNNRNDMAARQTVLINKEGIIYFIDRDVRVLTHGEDVLAKMRELGMIESKYIPLDQQH